jgi:predicted protein tyrosine phosphatase
MNVLFVCSRNKWRSRTAETIFKNDSNHDVRSAGTAHDARIRVTEKLIVWADLIFVMEKRHKEILAQKFGTVLDSKEIVILNVEDNYQYMDSELIKILRTSVSPFVNFK